MDKVYFNEFFNVSEKDMEQYGAYNMSLISDTEVFVDPILLYRKENKKYYEAHQGIINYIIFLRDKSINGNVTNSELEQYFCFKEVKQNWFGYARYGNGGHALGMDFAKELNEILRNYLLDFGNVQKRPTSRIEQLCLFNQGRGPDNISDFTVCLVKTFLLEYTQKFSQDYLSKAKCEIYNISRAYFNYKEQKWENKEYYLPTFKNNFVLLTPSDIIRKDESFVSYNDLVCNFDNFVSNLENEELRDRINTHFAGIIYHELSKKEQKDLVNRAVKENPEITYEYAFSKEKDINIAITENQKMIVSFKTIQLEKCKPLINSLRQKTDFYKFSDVSCKKNALQRLSILKKYLESASYKKYFFLGDKKIDNNLLKKLLTNVWYAGRPKVEAVKENYDLKFIPVYNAKIAKMLTNYYIDNAIDYKNTIVCYICLDESEFVNISKLVNKLGLKTNENIIIISSFE